MPDKKLTDNEIVKALECCIGDTDGKDCFGCPLYEIDDCQAHLNLAALDLINRLQAEKQNLEIELQAMRGAANSYKAEIKKLRYNLEAVLDERADHSEAYKEFAERLKEKSKQGKGYLGNVYHSVDVAEIDNLLKELVGDNQ